MIARKRRFEFFPKSYGFFPYIYLIYLFMPAYHISLETGWAMFVGYILLSLFLLTYRQLYFTSKYFTYWLVVQVVIVLILSIWLDIYNLFLGFFSAYFIGWYQDKKKFTNALVLFGLVIFTPLIVHFDSLLSRDSLFFLPFIMVMLFSPFAIRRMINQMELKKQLAEANETINEFIKREERMRIARDLHDTLGHTLSLITLKSQLAGKLITKDSARAQLEVKEIEKTSRTALVQVRELVSEMRTNTISEELLEAESILEAAGIHFHFSGGSKLENTPGLTQNILSMCLREAVTNVVKHSQAKNCFVHIKEQVGEATLSIQDDGKGIILKNSEGNGLKGIAERLALINGMMYLTEEKGTKLMITVPVVVKEKEAGVRS